jgi:hypothetical protein
VEEEKMLFGRFNDVREKMMMMMMKKIPERSGLRCGP